MARRRAEFGLRNSRKDHEDLPLSRSIERRDKMAKPTPKPNPELPEAPPEAGAEEEGVGTNPALLPAAASLLRIVGCPPMRSRPSRLE